MAKTGININVKNTVLGNVPRVNSNSMLIIIGSNSNTDGDVAFDLDTPYLLRSASDLKTLGFMPNQNCYETYVQVSEYFSRAGNSLLWLVGASDVAAVLNNLEDWVRATVVNGFQYRPRQIGFVSRSDATIETEYYNPSSSYFFCDPDNLTVALKNLYSEGFSTVAIMDAYFQDNVENASNFENLVNYEAPFVGAVCVTNRQGGKACIGLTLGYMASLSVGTSIGDASLPPFSTNFYFTDLEVSNGEINDYIHTICSKVSPNVIEELSEKGYIFMRTRPPRNGLWFNDGATCASPDTALSTLEAGRTLASMVDDLRSFFTPYINNRVPVDSNGDIQATYKQVVLDAARSKVVMPYIESGDISDARISLKAQDNDMIGSRTWEVTLEILPAPTLRWIEGFVFYVKSLN